jgi:hypothetical protein
MILCVFLTLVNWQQYVSYEINGYLDTHGHSLTATEHLTYHNNSPNSLDTLYLHLYANAYRDRETYYAREAYETGDERYTKAKPEERGYIDVMGILSGDVPLYYQIDETIVAVSLNQLLKTGDSLVMEIEFYVKIPKEFPGFGYWPEHYEMTQWYPKICVFDEGGWHFDQLHPLGGTYGEFATYDVIIDLPGEYVVAGTGKPIDPLEIQLLDTLITTGRKLRRDERKTVHFRAENVHDFAWVADASFNVEQCRFAGTPVLIYSRGQNDRRAAGVAKYAGDVLTRYNRWFGHYPYENLSIVDGFYGGHAVYPQMILLGFSEDQFTRLFESELASDIGKQWFSGVVGPNMCGDAWLGGGFATYAAVRYMEDKYGDANTLIKAPFFPPLSLRYVHRLYYYVIQTNQLEKPVSTAASEYADVPISYQNSAVSKPTLFLFSLEKILGRDTFDQILQEYFRAYNFKHVASDDFINMCEKVGKRGLTQLFDSFLHTTEFCDWRVNSVKDNKIEIENAGDLKIPVNVYVTTESSEHVFPLNAQNKKHTIMIPHDSGDVIKVAIDSTEYTLDPNYWNNYVPRKVSVRPIFDFDWPSLSTYQVLWTPYLWYDSYDGITAGFYLFGDNFADFDFVRGGYQITAGYTYGFKSGRHYPLLNYQTPVLFEDGKRVRIRFTGSRSRGGDNVSIGICSNIGRPFTRQPQVSIINMFSYNDLSTYSGLDSIDWDLGRNIVFENELKFRHSDLSVNVGLSLAHHVLGSEWEYLRMTLEAQRLFSFVVPFNVRLFVGKIFGEAPTQKRLFLSGALRANLLASLLFGQSGTYSPQERIHIPGDGNMRGYQTLHIKSDQMYILNLEFPTRTLIRVFTDIGYYDKFAFDAGVCLAIGSETFPFLPLYGLSISTNFPLYSYIEGEPWKFRWSFGFSL